LLRGFLVVALGAAGERRLDGVGEVGHRRGAYSSPAGDHSTGPARSTWAPNGRPSTSWAAREASIRRGRATPVSPPTSRGIGTTSAVETLPVEPGGTGQPPSSPKLDSKDSTPSSSAATRLARP